MPRVEPMVEPLWVRGVFRIYYAVRRLSPPRLLASLLLQIARVAKRLAYEQIWYWLPGEDALILLRPQAARLVETAVGSGDRVIDLGAGYGHVARLAAMRAREVLAIETNQRTAAIARSNCRLLQHVRIVQGDVWSEIERQGVDFDVALCCHFLEHVDDPTTALRRIRQRAAKIAIEVPDFSSDPLNPARMRLGLPFHEDCDHRVEFTRESLVECLSQSGWQTACLETTNGVLLAIAHRSIGSDDARATANVVQTQ